MKHVEALLIKFVMAAVILELVLYYLANLSFGNILWIALTITVLAYLIGDIWILRRTNNTAATIADIGLTFVVLLLFNYVFYKAAISVWDALLAAVIIGIGEWVYHKFLFRILNRQEKKRTAI